MQIKFIAKKLKEANEYVNLLNPPIKEETKKKTPTKNSHIFKKILNLLFK